MIGIIGAMDEEIQEILNVMEEVEHQSFHGIDFYHGIMNHTPVVVMKSGVAKVAAAMTTTVLLEHYDVKGLINIGTAGGLREEEEVLDVIISSKVAHHDVDVTPFGWPRGFDQTKTCYAADKRYIEAIEKVIDEKDRVFVGPLVSGDSFIYRQDQVDEILKNYPEALCAEMEAAAVAQVAVHYGKPFVVIRSLSDITLRDNNDVTFDEYVVIASKRSAKWCYKVVDMLETLDEAR